MKVVVAIDSFKGSMTSMQAGNACKEGILAAAHAHCGSGAAAAKDRKPAADNMKVVVKPLADGGEGTVEALVEGMSGTYEYVPVTGPMGNPVKARYGILPDQTVVMEMAEASGIPISDGGNRSVRKPDQSGCISIRWDPALLAAVLSYYECKIFI